MNKKLIVQYFEWYLPEDGKHWDRLKEAVPELAYLGFTDVWMPPAYKGHTGTEDVGYGVYDLYDLGEFDQKGTVPTKYGTREQYLAAIEQVHAYGMNAMADIVLNHRMGADEKQTTYGAWVEGGDRNVIITPRKRLDVWTLFNFPGRKGKYSEFVWNVNHFSATDWNQRTEKKGIFLFDGHEFSKLVDDENGNYDYLMGANVDFSRPEVRQELITWGKWYLDTTGVDSLRLDAVKHIPNDFFPEWLSALTTHRKQKLVQAFKETHGREPREEELRREDYELFAVGEFWSGNMSKLSRFLSDTEQVRQGLAEIIEKRRNRMADPSFWDQELNSMKKILAENPHNMSLFDVPLRHKFEEISQKGEKFDLTKLFEDTLVKEDPNHAVTFVDNHDTQPGQALEGWVNDWFKQSAYALILLRDKGTPCVFYGDLYGIPHDHLPLVKSLRRLLHARRWFATGKQVDYFDYPTTVGWTREGGMAVVINIGNESGYKDMEIGLPEEVFVDLLQNRLEEIAIAKEGRTRFPANAMSASVWVSKSRLKQLGGDDYFKKNR